MQSAIKTSVQLCGRCWGKNMVNPAKVIDYSHLCKKYTTECDGTRIGIIGAPMWKGQRKDGVDKGPDAIRAGGIVPTLNDMGLIVRDYGNVTFDEYPNDKPIGKIRNPKTVFNGLKKVSENVSKILEDGQVCLTLGGDHSLGISTVHGHATVYKDKMCLLWVDAHADINTANTTNSGNIHGMPVSFLLKELESVCPSLPGLEWLKPCLKADSIAYIGLRDVEPSEMKILYDLGIKHYTMYEIDKYGIHNVIQQAIDSVNPRGDKYMHVSFDIDAVDKVLAPSTGTPVSGGLTRREALSIAEEISSTGMLVGLDLVEVNPLLGREEDVQKTVAMAIDIIAGFMGRQRVGISIPNTSVVSSLPKP